MSIDELAKLKVGILGFGHEGQAVFSYLKKHGVEAQVLDQEKNGETYLDNLTEFSIVFRSPGIPRLHPKILTAEKAGVVITSQTKWFFEHSPAKIIGVTGTKGKGTTCSLIYKTLQEAGASVFLTGNIGKQAPFEFLDDLKLEDLVVFELSSFQLQDLTKSPQIGVCLMVTSDHLNHHKDLAEYHVAKSAITGFQEKNDIAIFNADYPATVEIGNLGAGRKLSISAKLKPVNGAYIEGDKIFLTKEDEQFERVIDCSERKLRGSHNLENIAASMLVCTELGISEEVISKVSNSFTGLEHRLQLVGTVNGVSYYNDSISTVPETAIAALNSFTEPTHIILGGSEKGLDYSNLVDEIVKRKNIASVTLLGEVGEKLKTLFSVKRVEQSWEVPVSKPFTDFKEAMMEIKTRAKAGDVVLLSPASASFGMFKNYAERGNEFARLVTSEGN